MPSTPSKIHRRFDEPGCVPDLLAEHRVVAPGANESEHRLFDGAVDFGHRSAVVLRGRPQCLRPKVLPRDRVGRVGEPVKKRDVIVDEHRHSIAEALEATLMRSGYGDAQ